MRRRWAIAAVLVALAAGCTASSGTEADRADGARLDRPLVVVAGPGGEAWVRLLRSTGMAARLGTFDELLARRAGVVGAAVPLTMAQRTDLRRWVQGGGRLVTANADVLADLGVERTSSRSVDGAEMSGVGGRASWAEPLDVEGLHGTDLAVLAADGPTILAADAPRRDGAVLALAVDPVADGRAGFELLPALGRAVWRWTGAPDGPSRIGAELYLDPGDLPADLVRHPARLAARLGAVRAVHIAGWNHDFNDPADDYDYAGLIDALHAHGILAYAWLEPPFVSLKTWDDHPECRERTSTGADAEVDWRLLIALEDPSCFAVATAVYDDLVRSFDFDGVNVAELYFEPSTSTGFTPFHPAALARFGADPAAEPERFLDFRTDLVTELNEQLLRHLNGLPGVDQLDLQLTVIDDNLDPAAARGVGSDTARLAEVAARQGATLQLEDPFTRWSDGPLRYDGLTPVLEAWDDVRAFVDVNVVDRDGARPTAKMTAGELDLALASAAQVRGRVGLYAVSTVRSGDRAYLPGAVAGAATTLDAGVRAPWTVRVSAPIGRERLTVDGEPWPVAAGGTFIPAGEHRLVWSAGAPVGPALRRLTAELGTMSGDARSLRFSYSAHGRSWAVVSHRPVGVDAVRNPDGGWTVPLPAGEHEVEWRFRATGGSAAVR